MTKKEQTNNDQELIRGDARGAKAPLSEKIHNLSKNSDDNKNRMLRRQCYGKKFKGWLLP